MSDSEITVRKLQKRVEEAKVAHTNAKKAFDQITQNLPTGMPHPDGAFSIQQAGREERRTLESYMRALKRFADFVLSGHEVTESDNSNRGGPSSSI
jgi:hypothetical protein